MATEGDDAAVATKRFRGDEEQEYYEGDGGDAAPEAKTARLDGSTRSRAGKRAPPRKKKGKEKLLRLPRWTLGL